MNTSKRRQLMRVNKMEIEILDTQTFLEMFKKQSDADKGPFVALTQVCLLIEIRNFLKQKEKKND